jgi:hypothetical protein
MSAAGLSELVKTNPVESGHIERCDAVGVYRLTGPWRCRC